MFFFFFWRACASYLLPPPSLRASRVCKKSLPHLFMPAQDVADGVAAGEGLVDFQGGAAGVPKGRRHALPLERLDEDVGAFAGPPAKPVGPLGWGGGGQGGGGGGPGGRQLGGRGGGGVGGGLGGGGGVGGGGGAGGGGAALGGGRAWPGREAPEEERERGRVRERGRGRERRAFFFLVSSPGTPHDHPLLTVAPPTGCWPAGLPGRGRRRQSPGWVRGEWGAGSACV